MRVRCDTTGFSFASDWMKTWREVEWFLFECRKIIGFALTTLHDCLKELAPIFHPIRGKPKIRTLRQLHVITWSFDWFTVLSVSFVISPTDYFGSGFTTLYWKPLYLNKWCSEVDAKLTFRH